MYEIDELSQIKQLLPKLFPSLQSSEIVPCEYLYFPPNGRRFQDGKSFVFGYAAMSPQAVGFIPNTALSSYHEPPDFWHRLLVGIFSGGIFGFLLLTLVAVLWPHLARLFLPIGTLFFVFSIVSVVILNLISKTSLAHNVAPVLFPLDQQWRANPSKKWILNLDTSDQFVFREGLPQTLLQQVENHTLLVTHKRFFFN